MIAVGAMDGVVPGLAHAEFRCRAGGGWWDGKNRPLEEKECVRSPNPPCPARALAESGTTSVTTVADRDGDIYEEFIVQPGNVELLIRVVGAPGSPV